MKRVFVIEDAYQDLTAALDYEGGELVVLIVMDSGTLATDVDRSLEDKRRLAQRIQEARRSRGQPCEVQVEWGPAHEVVRNCLVREQAEPLA